MASGFQSNVFKRLEECRFVGIVISAPGIGHTQSRRLVATLATRWCRYLINFFGAFWKTTIVQSHAQKREDVILDHALRGVRHGFYIDVGAQDPVADSVTKAFYERGWRGINLEPNQEYFRKLQDDRPDDINLAIAVGRETGDVSFHEVPHTGLSTTNRFYAQRHEQFGYAVCSYRVAGTTLDRICEDSSVGTVHFLKIDVEGSEKAVLEGFSFDEVRPWVVVIEATEPNSGRPVFPEWEWLLLERRYQFAYFDGLNRFYVAKEHGDLACRFSSASLWGWRLRQLLTSPRTAVPLAIRRIRTKRSSNRAKASGAAAS
jgi:FkbM family methyltransferase